MVKAVDAAVVQAAGFDEKAAGYCHAKGSSDCSELCDRLVLETHEAKCWPWSRTLISSSF